MDTSIKNRGSAVAQEKVFARFNCPCASVHPGCEVSCSMGFIVSPVLCRGQPDGGESFIVLESSFASLPSSRNVRCFSMRISYCKQGTCAGVCVNLLLCKVISSVRILAQLDSLKVYSYRCICSGIIDCRLPGSCAWLVCFVCFLCFA